jgi:hypothetical protein
VFCVPIFVCSQCLHRKPCYLPGSGHYLAEAEAAVSVNEEKWLVMHVHVQLRLDELRGPPNPWLACLCSKPVQDAECCCCVSGVVNTGSALSILPRVANWPCRFQSVGGVMVTKLMAASILPQQ